MNNNFFSILISIVNKVLDWLKNVLVRFKKAGFGLFFNTIKFKPIII